jgi:glycogen operon protein
MPRTGPLGARPVDGGVEFRVRAPAADRLDLCLFDGDRERRLKMRRDGAQWSLTIAGIGEGARYGFRADGPWNPRQGLKFDPQKLLVDPAATRLDRAFAWHPDLAAPRSHAPDTAPLVPKAVTSFLPALAEPAPAIPVAGKLIYEINVRAFTMRHPDIPEHERGTLKAVAHPAIVAHLKRLGVGAVELMPVAAWIDERHLPPLGLENAWGYNPVVFNALDPRLAPGGMADLRHVTDVLHANGIGVLLDVVYNHTGESDDAGPTLSLRGLGEADWYRRDEHGLINDTGCGNTLALDRPHVVALVLDSLRHFVATAGVDGFRFDLAVTLGRTERGFTPHAPLFEAIRRDSLLADRILIAEPWDIGPGGYHLGAFPGDFLEWNDRFRDDVRRFWRGDNGALGDLATRLAGSSDVFRHGGARVTRSVNFAAAHDGFSVADIVSYRQRHNETNGEGNRDGHGENHSWNNGVEGPTDDPAINAARARDIRALLATAFASRGTVMLTAGDEFGRSQRGNNNAYAQANDMTWLDWDGRDRALEDFVAALSAFRAAHPALSSAAFLEGTGEPAPDVLWFNRSGQPMGEEDWAEHAAAFLGAALADGDDRVAVVFNRRHEKLDFVLPPPRPRRRWVPALGAGEMPGIEGRSVVFFVEAAG